MLDEIKKCIFAKEIRLALVEANLSPELEFFESCTDFVFLSAIFHMVLSVYPQVEDRKKFLLRPLENIVAPEGLDYLDEFDEKDEKTEEDEEKEEEKSLDEECEENAVCLFVFNRQNGKFDIESLS
jgi:hypothetical protein